MRSKIKAPMLHAPGLHVIFKRIVEPVYLSGDQHQYVGKARVNS